MSESIADQSKKRQGRSQETDAEMTLEIRNLRKVYYGDGEEVVAVENMNVDVRDGEFLVFVGPSGCGKTTTLRCIAGLEEITEGSVIIQHEDVSGQAPRERDVAMVFQTYALYPHMTVRENIAYPLKVRGHEKEMRNQQVKKTAELLQIPELLDRQPADLSGGQQQRVALGRALVREPQVFLFDEPLSNLDAKLRIRMRTELNRLHNKIGETSIYVTHDQAEAMTLGDRIAVMRDAEIQQIAPPQMVYDEPANQFVAGFIGSPQMNFFNGTASTESARVVVNTDSFKFALPKSTSDKVDMKMDETKQVTFGIRPEDLYAKSVGDEWSESASSIEAKVLVVEEMGSNFHLTLERSETEFQGIVEPDSGIDRGDQVAIDFELEKCHLFDKSTGESLMYSPENDR